VKIEQFDPAKRGRKRPENGSNRPTIILGLIGLIDPAAGVHSSVIGAMT
jgi:hypothetical protein